MPGTHRPSSPASPSATWAAGLSLAATLCMSGVALGGWHPAMAGLAATFSALAMVSALWARAWLRRRSDLPNPVAGEPSVAGILESAMDPIVACDAAQRIVMFNAAAEKAFKWKRADILGKPLSTLVPDRYRTVHFHHVARFGQLGVTVRRMGGQTVLTAVRADGTEFPIEASISHYRSGGAQFYMAILRDVTERLRAEDALRRSKEELSQFANAASVAREQEKTRIARELHDELAQALTALKMDVSWSRRHLPEAAGPIDERLASVEKILDSTVMSTRRIAADLRPLMLDDLGLNAALEWLAEQFQERHGVTCQLDVEGLEDDLPENYATAIFRILQESLTNVARHAAATHVRVLVRRTGQEILIRVQDNGQGFSLAEQGKPGSFGLIGLRERAYMLGGETVITSAPGEGTRIEVRLPWTETVEP